MKSFLKDIFDSCLLRLRWRTERACHIDTAGNHSLVLVFLFLNGLKLHLFHIKYIKKVVAKWLCVRTSVCLSNQYVCLSGSTSEIVPGFLLLLTTIKIVFLPSWATLACPSVRLSVHQLIWNFYCMFSSDGILFLFLGRIMFSFYFLLLLLPKWRFLPNILHRVIAVLPYFVVVTVVVISECPRYGVMVVLVTRCWWLVVGCCWYWPDHFCTTRIK